MSSVFERALSLHEAGDSVAAMREYRAAVAPRSSATPQQIAASYSNLGMLLAADGRHMECAHYSRTAAMLAPTNPLVQYNLANAQFELRHDDEAISTFHRVLKLQRTHAPSYHNLALLANRKGMREEAVRLFRLTLACGPEELTSIGGAAQVYANMAAAGLASTSDMADALSAQRAAAAASPRDAEAQVRLAERLLEAATAAGDMRAEVSASGHVQSGAGSAALEAEAERVLRSATLLAPTDGRALNLLGTVLQGQPGRWQEAASMYEAAIKAAPRNADAYHNLGTVNQRLGRLEEAKAMYTRALSIAPSVPNIYVSMASLAPPGESAALLQQAVALRPTDADAYARLASSYAPRPLGGAPAPSEGKLRKAIRAMQHAVQLAPKHAGSRSELGRLRVALAVHLLTQGADDYALAAKLTPSDGGEAGSAAEAHSLAGVVLSSLGRAQEAAWAFEVSLDIAKRVAAAAEATSSAAEEDPATSEGRRAPAASGATTEAVSGTAAAEDESAGVVPASGRLSGGPAGSALAHGGIDWRAAALQLCTSGYWVLDGALGGAVAADIRQDTVERLLPLMQRGRVGAGVDGADVRTDWLWRHRRGEAAVVDSAAPHMAALHALFEALPAGLNALGVHSNERSPPCGRASDGQCEGRCESPEATWAPGPGCRRDQEFEYASGRDWDLGRSHKMSNCERSWSLAHVEDLQFACYRPNGYYRRHSDGQNASRRVLTAIYYFNPGWSPSDGGGLRLYHPSTGFDRVDLEPRTDRLVVFDSRIEHEVMPVAAQKPRKRKAHSGGASDVATPSAAPRCAATQWFQDVAPPLMRSPISANCCKYQK